MFVCTLAILVTRSITSITLFQKAVIFCPDNRKGICIMYIVSELNFVKLPEVSVTKCNLNQVFVLVSYTVGCCEHMGPTDQCSSTQKSQDTIIRIPHGGHPWPQTWRGILTWAMGCDKEDSYCFFSNGTSMNSNSLTVNSFSTCQWDFSFFLVWTHSWSVQVTPGSSCNNILLFTTDHWNPEDKATVSFPDEAPHLSNDFHFRLESSHDPVSLTVVFLLRDPMFAQPISE